MNRRNSYKTPVNVLLEMKDTSYMKNFGGISDIAKRRQDPVADVTSTTVISHTGYYLID